MIFLRGILAKTKKRVIQNLFSEFDGLRIA